MMRVMQWGMTAIAVAVVAGAATVGAQAPVKVELKDGQGVSIGTATLSPVMGAVQIQLDLKGLKPGPHGLHVHAVGKCEGPGFTTAGGHLNPANKKHGLLSPEGPHAGDMENFTVAADGTAKGMVMAKGLAFGSEANSVFANGATALVVHAGPDDGKTDPSGGSGDRIACGVITK
jgi:Cu-Zn family superoxide dismutase